MNSPPPPRGRERRQSITNNGSRMRSSSQQPTTTSLQDATSGLVEMAKTTRNGSSGTPPLPVKVHRRHDSVDTVLASNTTKSDNGITDEMMLLIGTPPCTPPRRNSPTTGRSQPHKSLHEQVAAVVALESSAGDDHSRRRPRRSTSIPPPSTTTTTTTNNNSMEISSNDKNVPVDASDTAERNSHHDRILCDIVSFEELTFSCTTIDKGLNTSSSSSTATSGAAANNNNKKSLSTTINKSANKPKQKAEATTTSNEDVNTIIINLVNTIIPHLNHNYTTTTTTTTTTKSNNEKGNDNEYGAVQTLSKLIDQLLTSLLLVVAQTQSNHGNGATLEVSTITALAKCILSCIGWWYCYQYHAVLSIPKKTFTTKTTRIKHFFTTGDDNKQMKLILQLQSSLIQIIQTYFSYLLIHNNVDVLFALVRFPISIHANNKKAAEEADNEEQSNNNNSKIYTIVTFLLDSLASSSSSSAVTVTNVKKNNSSSSSYLDNLDLVVADAAMKAITNVLTVYNIVNYSQYMIASKEAPLLAAATTGRSTPILGMNNNDENEETAILFLAKYCLLKLLHAFAHDDDENEEEKEDDNDDNSITSNKEVDSSDKMDVGITTANTTRKDNLPLAPSSRMTLLYSIRILALLLRQGLIHYNDLLLIVQSFITSHQHEEEEEENNDDAFVEHDDDEYMEAAVSLLQELSSLFLYKQIRLFFDEYKSNSNHAPASSINKKKFGMNGNVTTNKSSSNNNNNHHHHGEIIKKNYEYKYDIAISSLSLLAYLTHYQSNTSNDNIIDSKSSKRMIYSNIKNNCITSLFNNGIIDHLLSISFGNFDKFDNNNNHHHATTTTTTAADASFEAIQALNDIVCQCNSTTGGLTILRSSRVMTLFVMKGWKTILLYMPFSSHLFKSKNKNGRQQTLLKDNDNEEEEGYGIVPCSVRTAISSLRTLHAHIPSVVRQSLRDVLIKHASSAVKKNDKVHTTGVDSSTQEGGEDDEGIMPLSNRSSGLIFSLQQLACNLLSLSTHNDIAISSNANALFQCLLLKGPPPNSSSTSSRKLNNFASIRHDEISRGLWSCLESTATEEEGGKGSSNVENAITDDSRGARRLLMLQESFHQEWLRYAKHMIMSSSPNGERHDDFSSFSTNLIIRGSIFPDIFHKLQSELRLCTAINLVNLLIKSESCMKRFINGGLLVAAQQGDGANISTFEGDSLTILSQIASNQISISKLSKTEKQQDSESFISVSSYTSYGSSGALSNTFGTMLVIETLSLLAKVAYSYLSPTPISEDDLISRDIQLLGRGECGMVEAQSEELRIDRIQSVARKMLSDVLVKCNNYDEKSIGGQQASTSRDDTTRPFESSSILGISIKPRDAIMDGLSQSQSRATANRTLHFVNELMDTCSHENVNFSVDSLFTSSMLRDQSAIELVKCLKLERSKVVELKRSLKTCSKARHLLELTFQRDAIIRERELNDAKAQAHAESMDVAHEYEREKEQSERHAHACQRAVRHMKHQVDAKEEENRKLQDGKQKWKEKALQVETEADKLAKEVSMLFSSLKKEKEENVSKENTLRGTLEEITNLRDQMSSIAAGRTAVEQKLCDSEMELASVRSVKDQAENKIEDAFGKLIALAEAFKEKDNRLNALQLEMENQSLNDKKRLDLAFTRCTEAESRESKLKSENEKLSKKLIKLKTGLKDESEKSKRAAAAYRDSRM